MALCLGACALILVGCGNESNNAEAESKREAAKTPPASALGTEAADPIVPSGWKTVSDGQWSLSIPEDWVDDSGFYYPEGAVSSSTGRPNISCIIGVRTIAEGQTAEDELKAMLGPGPMTKTPMTVCNKDGYMVEEKIDLVLVFEDEWLTSFGRKPGIECIYCEAPSSSKFSQYEAIFRRILESTDCSAG